MATARTDAVASALNPGVARKEVFAWAMFDFANSSYTTIVITAIFNAYFVGVVAGNAPWATFAWTLSLSASYAIVMLLGPVVGAWCDRNAAKKRALAATTLACVACTAALATASAGNVAWAVVLIIASNVFYALGENIIAAFLPEIAKPQAIGKVSGWGWSLGYVGGLLGLAICLAYVTWAQSQGQSASSFVPVTMLITAALFGFASLPTFLLLKERALARADGELAHPLRGALAQTLHTLHEARRFVDLWRFFLCALFYQAGVAVVIALAAIYAEQAMGFTTKDTLMLVMIVNVTAAIGAFAFGQVQDRIGHRATIALTLVGWLAMIGFAVFVTDRTGFWIAANLAGLCMGSSQSAGRALVGLLSPAAQRAEFYGLWGLVVRLAAIVGPITYGAITWATHNDHRLALMTTSVFFIAGLLVLVSVDVRRGIATARTPGSLD